MIKEIVSKKGMLLIIKNYSGDIMNFKNGVYLVKEDGIEVDYVKVDDDIVVEDSLYIVGCCGVVGVILVYKIVGVVVEVGMDLGVVKVVVEKVVVNVCIIGLVLMFCIVLVSGLFIFIFVEDEMEYGVGIYGELGIKCEKMLLVDELVNCMINDFVKDLGVKDGEEIVILVNGFGGILL